VAAVQLGRRIRASVSRLDESTREETSVNAKPNEPLRTFHEAALNYGVDITKTDPAVSWWICGKQSGIIGRTSGFARVPDSNSMHPASDCGGHRSLILEAQSWGRHGGDFFFSYLPFTSATIFYSHPLDLLPDSAIIRLSTDSPVLSVGS
jgi:hypothetical protein